MEPSKFLSTSKEEGRRTGPQTVRHSTMDSREKDCSQGARMLSQSTSTAAAMWEATLVGYQELLTGVLYNYT